MQPDPISALIQHIFALTTRPAFERVREGGSTEVYRIWQGDQVFYLRVLPEQDASFAPEALVHRRLLELKLHVPEVMYFEHLHPALQRSVMVTTAIAGSAIGHAARPDDVKAILIAAGQELAAINSVPVAGFGWIRRDMNAPTQLEAEFRSYRAWLHHDLDEQIVFLRNVQVFGETEVRAIQRILTRYDDLLNIDQAYLAHGDFDPTHIYHDHGAYTGIIDFGEIRGANALYDLGHFNVENSASLPDLLAGYRRVAALPSDYQQRIELTSLLIATRRLGRWVRRRQPTAWHDNFDFIAIQRLLKKLLT